jgi:hypothetical protein
MAYASGMKYDEFWNATLAEALANVEGYIKRNDDYLRGVRKVCWHVVLPWIKENARGSEYDVFAINGDPTPEEMEAMRKKANEQKNKQLVAKLQNAKQILDEHEKGAANWMKGKM